MPPMQWFFDIVTEQMLLAGFINDWSRARLWQSVRQAIPSGAWRKVELDSVSFSNLITVDLPNNQLIVTVQGYYLFQGRTTVDGLTDQKRLHIRILVNGNPVDYGGDNVSRASESLRPLCSTLVFLNVGDILDMWVYHDHGINRWTSPYEYLTWLDCHRHS